jgi:hypothetical protein
MMSDKPETASGSLAFTDNISIDWKPVDFIPGEDHLAMVSESNESFLRAVSAIGEFPGDTSEEDESISQEIARLDLKVNLLLDLVSQLIYKQLEIPERVRVTVSSSDIEWGGGRVADPGTVVFVQAYIQHGTPKPLCFYGEVISNQADVDSGVTKVRYLGLSGSVLSWLEKLIFRHHRREIAYRKSVSGAS